MEDLKDAQPTNSAGYGKRFANWALKKILANFFSGLLIIFPAAATIFIIWKSFTLMDNYLGEVVKKIFGYEFPGVGILLTFGSITLIGYLVSRFASGAVIAWIEKFLSRIPVVRTIYSSMKDFSEAFIGEKKKFTEPVLVRMNDKGILKIGFLTQKDLTQLKLTDHSAVYFPYSYSFMGALNIISNDRIIPVDVNSTELMKFIISAGVTNLEETHKTHKPEETNSANQ